MEETNTATDVITTKFEDVKKLTTEEYFEGNQFSIHAFRKKYTAQDDETYTQALKRVCDYIASVEATQELRDYWSARWFDEIFNDWWHPAGSIMQGAGSGRKISLSNCFSRDTEFITDQGLRTFECFNDGQTINVMNSYGAFVPSKVRNFGHQRLYKLTLGRHTLKKEVYCTFEHIWRTIEKGGTIVEKRTKDLSQFDQLPYVKRKWMPSSGGSRYYCPIGFIHGFVYGDGDWDKSTNTCRLNLCGDSKELVKLFTGFNWSITESEDTIRIQYLPSHFKSEMPDLDKYNEEYVLGFLIGYFAADGSVDDQGRAYLACAHNDILLRLKKIVESLGIYCSDIRLMRDESPFDGNPDHKCYGVHIWKDCLFDSFFTKANHKENWEIYKNSLTKDKSKVNWKVISLEETDRVEDVWCVQVPEFHNFTLSGGLNTGNCTTISLGKLRSKEEEWDNLESIVRNTGYTVAKCAAYRQGLGVDFSALRPAGTKVLNSANESTGAVHWMDFIDGIGRYVGQKGRIPAMLFSISCDHPDVEDFIQVKAERRRIQNANISVQCTEKFYRAVENNEDWELKFEVPAIKKGDKIYLDVHSIDMNSVREKETGKYYRIATHDRKREVFSKTVKARALMELIAKQMHANAEPGIQNIDLARKYSNSDAMYDPNDEYDSRILSTNACSEQYLSRESLCVLASVNVARFSTTREIYIGQLEKIGKSVNRFLDNVNECELRYQTYATPHQKLAIQKLRRTGAGVTNIAAWLFKQNLPYAASHGNDAIEDFMMWFNYWLYVSTEEIGKEKGDFGLFKADKWQAAPFVARMIEKSKELNEAKGVPVLTGKHARNVTVSSIAPTGTLSLMFRGLVLSYGIEPPFFMYFWKRTRMSGSGYTYYFNVPRVVREMFETKGYKIPMEADSIQDTWDGKIGKPIAEFIDKHRNEFKFLESTDVKPMDKLEMMSRVMKWVDSSISTTYMLPEDSDWKEVYKFILASHEKEVKSIAAFPDKKMYGIVSKISFRDLAFKLKEEGLGMFPSDFSEEEMKELNISPEKISYAMQAPKRLEVLDADIYVVSVKGEKFVMVVGLQNGEPYEIFGGHVNGFKFKFTQKKGKIAKVKKGQYALEIDDLVIEDFSKQFTPTEQILFRMASMSMRHGVPIPFVVEQLQKATQDITSMAAAAARVLKKYIKNGQTVHGQKCPSCGKELVYIDGCVSCASCGYSKCA